MAQAISHLGEETDRVDLLDLALTTLFLTVRYDPEISADAGIWTAGLRKPVEFAAAGSHLTRSSLIPLGSDTGLQVTVVGEKPRSTPALRLVDCILRS